MSHEIIIYKYGYFKIMLLDDQYFLERLVKDHRGRNCWRPVDIQKANVLGAYRLVKLMEQLREEMWEAKHLAIKFGRNK